MALYTRKVRKLFQSMDDSGDGALNLEEPLGSIGRQPKDLFPWAYNSCFIDFSGFSPVSHHFPPFFHVFSL